MSKPLIDKDQEFVGDSFSLWTIIVLAVCIVVIGLIYIVPPKTLDTEAVYQAF